LSFELIETAEFRLLRQSCAACFPKAAGPIIDDLIDVDWDRFLALARRHRVQGLCAAGVDRLRVSVPAQVRAALQADRRAIAADGLRAVSQCGELQAAFGAASLPLLFLKGITVAQLAYGDPFLKMGWDVDILVQPADLPAAAVLLQRLGYLPMLPRDVRAIDTWHRRSKESVWLSDGGLTIELHTRLTDNPELLGRLEPFSAPRPVEVVPGVTLPTLGSEELFAYLAVHGASSAWFRLKWVCDLAALITARSDGEIESLHRRASEFGAGRASAWALLLCRRLFGVAGASVERLGFDHHAANCRLLRLGLAELADEVEPTKRLLGTRRIHLAQLLLKPGLGFAAREARRQLRTLVVNRRASPGSGGGPDGS
jgi:hypothetical protein